jgi:hypothetical protein
VIAHSDPCAAIDPVEGTKATVYYSTATTGWTTTNIHYQPTGGSWTTAPGAGMESACTGWWRETLDLGTATSLKAAFNNGNGVWDNNNSADCTIPAGTTTVKDRTVTEAAKDPCAAEEPDTEAPTAPTQVTASATHASIVVSWDASTDDTGVTNDQVTRTGGTKGTTVTDAGPTVLSDTGLEERATYTYTVRAVDAAGNTSPASAEAGATTGEKAPEPASGTPLGTDPRKDPISFVLTARFHDGDSSNHRGGGQHAKSGNAANDDPMFRGDFKGLVDRLDYIKALGFSAVWITPVVLNRSDYDYHGYHGYDFSTVDPRLESAGAYGPNKSSDRYSGGTDAWAENMALMWTFRGIPTLYYGSEIEFRKGRRVDCGPTCPLATTGRAYYGGHLAGSVTASDFGEVDSARSTRRAARSPRRSPNRWSSTSNASTRSAARSPPSRRASTPPRASAARWPSNAGTPADPPTASPSSPSPSTPPTPAYRTAPTGTPSPAT